MRTFLRLIRFALESMTRNIWLALATMTVFMLTLFAVHALIVLNVIVERTVETFEQRIVVEVYFEDTASPELQQSVRGYLLGLPQVKGVTTVSADQALATFKERHANDPTILAALDEVDGNPLPAALTISAAKPDDLPFILEAVKTPEFAPYIRETIADDDVVLTIARFHALADRVQNIGLGVATFFALIALLIVFNTVRMAIYVQREEIGVMKLVGAQNAFIRGPFLIEVAVYSFLSTIAAFALVWGSLTIFAPQMASFFSGVELELPAFYLIHAPVILGAQFAALLVLSFVTTMLAMRRYLRA